MRTRSIVKMVPAQGVDRVRVFLFAIGRCGAGLSTDGELGLLGVYMETQQGFQPWLNTSGRSLDASVIPVAQRLSADNAEDSNASINSSDARSRRRTTRRRARPAWRSTCLKARSAKTATT